MQQILHTSRLKLRLCEEADIELLHHHWTEPSIMRYLWDGRIISRNTVQGVIASSLDSSRARGYGLWLLLGHQDGAFRGVCGLRDEALGWPALLYSISTAYWGLGFATESSRCVLRYTFEVLELGYVVATVDKPNVASIRVLEKLGMSVTGEKLVNGNPIIYYSLSRADFNHL